MIVLMQYSGGHILQKFCNIGTKIMALDQVYGQACPSYGSIMIQAYGQVC